jgi:alanine racemase
MISFGQSILIINLAAIASNYQLLQKKCIGSEVGAAVKANSYGLGALEIAPILYNNGCRKFFVAHAQEGIMLRELYADIEIIVLHGVYEDNSALFLEYDLLPVINNLEQFILWQKIAMKLEKTLSYILHIDTGMHRLGLPVAELSNYLALEKSYLDLKLVMSHLISSQEKESEINKLQLEKFLQLKEYFPNTHFSLSNSGGIFLGPEYHFDLCRSGAAIYGIDSISDQETEIKPVATLLAPIIHIDDLAPGESVGYDRTYINNMNHCKIATIPIGYADGLGRNLSNNIAFFIEGYKAPVLGLISMDLTVIDISNIPQRYQKLGQNVEIIGKHNSLRDIANIAQTNQYEILTKLGNRFKKIYNK